MGSTPCRLARLRCEVAGASPFVEFVDVFPGERIDMRCDGPAVGRQVKSAGAWAIVLLAVATIGAREASAQAAASRHRRRAVPRSSVAPAKASARPVPRTRQPASFLVTSGGGRQLRARPHVGLRRARRVGGRWLPRHLRVHRRSPDPVLYRRGRRPGRVARPTPATASRWSPDRPPACSARRGATTTRRCGWLMAAAPASS